MQVHQAHRLPWTELGQILVRHWNRERNPGNHKNRVTDKELRILGHFSRCFADALKEFADTDQTNQEDENGYSLNPEDWGICSYNRGFCLGYYYTLLYGYIYLNLVLLDADTFQPLLTNPKGSLCWDLEVVAGNYDGGHPHWVSQRFKRALAFTKGRGENFKPLTADVMQIIRDHAALLFRCLYSISGTNYALHPSFVYECVAQSMHEARWWDYDAVDVRHLKATRREMEEVGTGAAAT